ncbi:hypothetical protein ACFSTC_02125 [Nonomuraea ferruginea]
MAWQACTDLMGPDGKTMTPEPALECGTLAVPLDYSRARRRHHRPRPHPDQGHR